MRVRNASFWKEDFIFLIVPFVTTDPIGIGYRKHFADLEVDNKWAAGRIVHRYAIRWIYGLNRGDCWSLSRISKKKRRKRFTSVSSIE